MRINLPTNARQSHTRPGCLLVGQLHGLRSGDAEGLRLLVQSAPGRDRVLCVRLLFGAHDQRVALRQGAAGLAGHDARPAGGVLGRRTNAAASHQCYAISVCLLLSSECGAVFIVAITMALVGSNPCGRTVR